MTSTDKAEVLEAIAKVTRLLMAAESAQQAAMDALMRVMMAVRKEEATERPEPVDSADRKRELKAARQRRWRARKKARSDQ